MRPIVLYWENDSTDDETEESEQLSSEEEVG